MTHHEKMDTTVVVLINLRCPLCVYLSLMLACHQLYLLNGFYIDFFEDYWLHLIHDVLYFLSLG